MAPVHELRRASDGKLVCKLEEADISALEATGWKPPEVFVAKGRDGKTDIWGIICRPKDFDPSKKYPVIEYDLRRPARARSSPRPSARPGDSPSLTDLGFIVVQIDGMGTANRSKAFHDVCWHNIKDAGFPDRILWHQAVAKKYPWYDLSRVGIYGTSAGGQNATGGVLFHPEFYKVAVSACGCHDNRMDKASWNEQWMGYPVGPGTTASVQHRQRPPAPRQAAPDRRRDGHQRPARVDVCGWCDALIKADKDFDCSWSRTPTTAWAARTARRRMNDFFVRHLLANAAIEREAARSTSPWPAPARARTSKPKEIAKPSRRGRPRSTWRTSTRQERAPGRDRAVQVDREELPATSAPGRLAEARRTGPRLHEASGSTSSRSSISTR